MEILEDSNIYPMTLKSNFLINYVKRNVPCIVFFELISEPLSESLVKNIKQICMKYPKVFCYRLRWQRHIIQNILIKSSECYTVTVWRKCEKIKSFNYPNIEELNMMFSYVQSRINGADFFNYQLVLHFENKRKKRNENKRKNYMIKRKETFNKNKFQTLKRSFNKISKYSFPKTETPFILPKMFDDQISDNFFLKTKQPTDSNDSINNLVSDNLFLNNPIDTNASNVMKYRVVSYDEIASVEGLLLLSQPVNFKKLPKCENRKILQKQCHFNLYDMENNFNISDKIN